MHEKGFEGVKILFVLNATYFILNCERSEPRSHFISRWNMIVQVIVDLNRTVVDSDWHFDNLRSSRFQSQSWFVSHQFMVLNSG